ncbi:hypothetical protein GT354_19140 [Streptomyces sp. SID3343]|nr:hypothetical protein [Streptomyces sp. SID3343]
MISASGPRSSARTQTEAVARTPPGYRAGLQRGHLLGLQLGGSGVELRNLVPIEKLANSPVMRACEKRVKTALEGGDQVYYTSRPIYDGVDPIPTGIRITARGRTVNFDETIKNVNNSRHNPC